MFPSLISNSYDSNIPFSAYRVHNTSGPTPLPPSPLSRLKQDLHGKGSTWSRAKPVRGGTSSSLLGLPERIANLEKYTNLYEGTCALLCMCRRKLCSILMVGIICICSIRLDHYVLLSVVHWWGTCMQENWLTVLEQLSLLLVLQLLNSCHTCSLCMCFTRMSWWETVVTSSSGYSRYEKLSSWYRWSYSEGSSPKSSEFRDEDITAGRTVTRIPPCSRGGF